MGRKKTTLVPLVKEYVRNEILAYRLAPQEVLSDSKLCDDMLKHCDVVVSRSPVREALQQLIGEGFVTIIDGKTCVADITAEEVFEVCEVRSAMECMSVKLVKKRGLFTAEEKAAFQKIHQDLIDSRRENATGADKGRYYEIDDQFHRRLVECSGNKRFQAIHNNAEQHLRRVRWIYYITTYTNNMVCWHEKMLIAVLNDDFDGLEEAINQHHGAVIKSFTQFFREKVADCDLLDLMSLSGVEIEAREPGAYPFNQVGDCKSVAYQYS